MNTEISFRSTNDLFSFDDGAIDKEIYNYKNH